MLLLRYNRTLAAIGRYSLATVTPAGIELHRLVQTVIQARLPCEDERVWVDAAVCLLRRAFPDDTWETSTNTLCRST